MHGKTLGGAGLLAVALGTSAALCSRADQPRASEGAADSAPASAGDSVLRRPIGDPGAKERPPIVLPRQDTLTTARPADE